MSVTKQDIENIELIKEKFFCDEIKQAIENLSLHKPHDKDTVWNDIVTSLYYSDVGDDLLTCLRPSSTLNYTVEQYQECITHFIKCLDYIKAGDCYPFNCVVDFVNMAYQTSFTFWWIERVHIYLNNYITNEKRMIFSRYTSTVIFELVNNLTYDYVMEQ